MRTGKVIGRVWAAKKLEQLPVGTLLKIEFEAGAETIVAFDPFGCGENEEVLVVSGTVARDYLARDDALVDAIVVASLDTVAAKT